MNRILSCICMAASYVKGQCLASMRRLLLWLAEW